MMQTTPPKSPTAPRRSLSVPGSVREVERPLMENPLPMASLPPRNPETVSGAGVATAAAYTYAPPPSDRPFRASSSTEMMDVPENINRASVPPAKTPGAAAARKPAELSVSMPRDATIAQPAQEVAVATRLRDTASYEGPRPAAAAAIDLNGFDLVAIVEESENPKQFTELEVKRQTIGRDRLTPQNLKDLPIDDVIRQAKFGLGQDIATQLPLIIAEFNKGKEPCYTVSATFGERTQPGNLRLVHRNFRAQLIPGDGQRYRLRIDPMAKIEDIHTYPLTTLVIGMHDTFLVTVPQGHVLKARLGAEKKPILLAEGRHVIHDPNFEIAQISNQPPSSALVKAWDAYIQHEQLHVLRIPQGEMAKVEFGPVPALLMAKEDGSPYCFDDASFKLTVATPNEPFFNANVEWLQHKSLNRLRILPGKTARVLFGAQPVLLPSRIQPYQFSRPDFSLVKPQAPAGREENFVDNTNEYYNHGDLHVLNVPLGCIAKVFRDGIRPEFLEGREAPYLIKDAKLRVVRANADNLFEDATSPLIVHGALKRVIPKEGQVAVTFCGGKLQIVEPTSKAFLITDPQHTVKEFLSTNVQTITFPSQKYIREKQKEGVSAERQNYFVFGTQDRVEIGVKIMVIFKIARADFAVKSLCSMQGILDHLENIVVAEMGKAIQALNSSNFNANTQPKAMGADTVFDRKRGMPLRVQAAAAAAAPLPETGTDIVVATPVVAMDRSNFGAMDAIAINADGAMEEDIDFTTPPQAGFLGKFNDDITAKLQRDVADFGIDLTNVQIETPIMLDKELREKMSKLTLDCAEVAAQRSMVDQKREVAEKTARTEAAKNTITQEQEFAKERLRAATTAEVSKITRQGDLNSLTLELQAHMETAKNEAAQQKIKAETEQQMALLKTESDRKQREMEMATDRQKREMDIEMQEKQLAILRQKAQLYAECPALVQLELAKYQAEALAGFQVVSPDAYFSLLPRMQQGGFGGIFSPAVDPRAAAAVARGVAAQAEPLDSDAGRFVRNGK